MEKRAWCVARVRVRAGVRVRVRVRVGVRVRVIELWCNGVMLREARLVCGEGEHDQVRVEAVDAVVQVGIIPRGMALGADEGHRLVLAWLGVFRLRGRGVGVGVGVGDRRKHGGIR